MFVSSGRDPLRGVRAMLLAVVVAGTLVSPVLERRQAEAVGVLPLAALCALSVPCVAFVGAAVAFAVYQGTASDPLTLEKVATAARNVWLAFSDGERDAYGAQALAGRVTWSNQMLALLNAEYASLLGGTFSGAVVYGWPQVIGDVHYQHTDGVGTTRTDTGIGNPEFVARSPVNYFIPEIWLNSAGYKYFNPQPCAPPNTSVLVQAKMYRADTDALIASSSRLAVTAGSTTSCVVSTSLVLQLGGSSSPVSDVEYLRTAGYYIEYLWWGAAAPARFGISVGPFWANNDHTASPSWSATVDTLFPANGFQKTLGAETLGGGLGTIPGNGTLTVRVPADADDVIGQVGNPVYVGTDGAAGVGVGVGEVAAGPATTSLTDSTRAGWWESNFNRIVAAVSGLALPLQRISDWVTDFPAQLTSSLTTALTSFMAVTATWAGTTTSTTALIEAAAPACMVTGSVSALTGFYASAGSSDVVIPLAIIGGTPIELTLSDSDGAALSRLTTRVALLALIAMYSFGLWRRAFEGG